MIKSFFKNLGRRIKRHVPVIIDRNNYITYPHIDLNKIKDEHFEKIMSALDKVNYRKMILDELKKHKHT